MNFKAQSYFNIEVNGKKRFSLNVRDIYSVYADLYTLKGNRHFLKLKCQNIANDHIDYDRLLAYKSGKNCVFCKSNVSQKRGLQYEA